MGTQVWVRVFKNKLKQRWKNHRFIYNCCCKMWIYMKSLPEYIHVRVFSTWSVLKHTPLLIVVYVHHFKVMNWTEGLDIFVLICKRVFIGVTILSNASKFLKRKAITRPMTLLMMTYMWVIVKFYREHHRECLLSGNFYC